MITDRPYTRPYVIKLQIFTVDMVYKSGQIFLPFCHNTGVWRTDGQTERRTDRQNSHR